MENNTNSTAPMPAEDPSAPVAPEPPTEPSAEPPAESTAESSAPSPTPAEAPISATPIAAEPYHPESNIPDPSTNKIFDSYNIGRKENIAYFNGEKAAEEQKKQKSKKNIFMLAIIAVVLAIAAVFAFLYFTVWNQTASNNTVYALTEWETELGDIMTKFYNYVDASEPGRAIDYATDEASKQSDPNKIFEIKSIECNYYLSLKQLDNALACYNNLTSYQDLTELNKFAMYTAIAHIYRQKGEPERADGYRELINEFYPGYTEVEKVSAESVKQIDEESKENTDEDQASSEAE